MQWLEGPKISMALMKADTSNRTEIIQILMSSNFLSVFFFFFFFLISCYILTAKRSAQHC